MEVSSIYDDIWDHEWLDMPVMLEDLELNRT